MQVQPGSNLLQALSGALQSPGKSPQIDAAQPAPKAAPKQKVTVLAETATPASAGVNMNAPRGTYLNIRV